MKKKEGLFVKINYNNIGMGHKSNTKELHKSSDANIKKYLLCAGVFNKQGGTMIFQVKNMDEAHEILKNNPFIGSKTYSYEILKNDVIAL